MNRIKERTEWILELGGVKKDVILLLISAAALLNSMARFVSLPFDSAWIAIVLCGIPIVTEALIGLVTSFDIKADVLVSLALVASVCIGEDFAAGEVAFIMQLGALLEKRTVAKARAGIEKLVHLTPRTARVIRDGQEEIISAEKVEVGDVIRVLPGETIPVDGVVLSGQTSVNQAVVTGESLPVDKEAGDDVSSGTVNQFGAFDMRASRVGEDSSIQRMIKLVQSADAGKAKIVSLADRWATWIVIIALTSAVLTWLVTGEIIRGVTILVVFCPCALVLATPTAIMAAIGNATKHGFLVREGDALERLSEASVVTFDKTGTLTYGTPKVIAVKTVSRYTEEELYAYAAAVEQMSEHPLGKAIVKGYGRKCDEAEYFKMRPGEGVEAVVAGKKILAGNKKLVLKSGSGKDQETEAAAEQYVKKGCSVIYISVEHVPAGYIVLSDTVRTESGVMIEQLKELGIRPVLLTGDNQNAADAIAGQLGMQEVYAECSPEEKLRCMEHFQSNRQRVCMTGDGINDAPALKRADIGIAMGGIGSDIAVDAADIVLVKDEIRELPHLFSLSRKMMTTIRQNLTFSMSLNFLSIILAMTGILNPVLGALVHNAGSVLVIFNSAILLKWKHRK